MFLSIRSLGRSILLAMLVALAWFSAFPPASAAGDATRTARIYGRVGYLALAPSPTDMGYIVVGGGETPFTSTGKMNVGAGAQVLFPLGSARNLKVGADVGGFKLFSDQVDLYYGGDDHGDVHKDSEFTIHALGIVEYAPPGSALFLQGGAGVHHVLWTWSQETPDLYRDDSGSGQSLGLMAAVGMHAGAGAGAGIPLMLRVDYLARYGTVLSIGLTGGFEFGF